MDDRARVAELLGREPFGAFEVAVRDETGDPVVLCNAPFLRDGTPMPTRYYLVGPDLVRDVSRLEAAGGVNAAEAAVDPADLVALHLRYAAERDAAIETDREGPRPSGGVGGTRVGVKCLHAHVAYLLAGGDDPVGRWALAQLTSAASQGGDVTPVAGAPESRPINRQPGSVTVVIDDRELLIEVEGGGAYRLATGPLSLMDGPLCEGDPPRPASLTNAFGLVQDHLDDLLIDAPSIASAPAVIVVGRYGEAMARVELGADTIPADYELRRADADEVFRTLAVESVDDRRHNPGLPDDQVESIIATCCVVLGIMRRLELRSIQIRAAAVLDGQSGTSC